MLYVGSVCVCSAHGMCFVTHEQTCGVLVVRVSICIVCVLYVCIAVRVYVGVICVRCLCFRGVYGVCCVYVCIWTYTYVFVV